jgi:hypothetical protein
MQSPYNPDQQVAFHLDRCFNLISIAAFLPVSDQRSRQGNGALTRGVQREGGSVQGSGAPFVWL